MNIVHCVRDYDEYFELKKDGTRLFGFSSIKKCTVLYGYGFLTWGFRIFDHLRMYESIAIDATYRFCKTVNAMFGPKYLRQLNAEETVRLMAQGEAREFPEMRRRIDCMHGR